MEKNGGGNTKSGLRKIIPLVSDSLPQGNYRADGVVLLRSEASPRSGECLLFLRGLGAVRAGTPGPRGRFGGAAEPMIWGSFLLYQGPRRLYVKGVDVAEDFLPVRASRRSLTCAVRWCGELASRLPHRHEDDGLLSLFWGSMKNLSLGLCATLLDVRFAWRWGNIWGVAPSLERCPRCCARLDYGGAVFRAAEGFVCRDCAESGRAAPCAERDPVPGDTFEVIRSSCLPPARSFAGLEPDLRARAEPGSRLEKEVKGAADWLFSFLKII